jgi:hypothetical protein
MKLNKVLFGSLIVAACAVLIGIDFSSPDKTVQYSPRVKQIDQTYFSNVYGIAGAIEYYNERRKNIKTGKVEISDMLKAEKAVYNFGKMSKQSFLKNLGEGLKFVHSTKPFLIIIGITALHCTLTMSFESVLPYFAVHKLGAEGSGVSYLMMCVGVGSLITSLILAGATDGKLRGKLFYFYALLSGIAPILLSFSSNLYFSLFAMILMGFSQAGFMIIVHTIIQIMSPDYVRGRIAGVYSMYVGGSMALFNFINGFSADYIDPGYSLALQGLIFTLIVFVYRNHEVLFYIYKGNYNDLGKYSKMTAS